jgi:uncharacterized protein (DUF433 family)
MPIQVTPAQAAAVTGLSLAAVHKAIDTRLIRPRMAKPGGDTRRLLNREQVVYLQLEADGLRLLPLRTRRELAAVIERTPDVEYLAVGPGKALNVNVKAARMKVASELKRLVRARAMATSDPAIMHGTPVFRGTRIPIQLVADMHAQGASPAEILEGYPSLSPERIALASVYVRAFPRRGRPIRRPWAGQKPIRTSNQPSGAGQRRVA